MGGRCQKRRSVLDAANDHAFVSESVNNRPMTVFKLAFRNILRHRRRSLAIAGLVAGGTALLVSGNAVLSSAESGIRKSFIDSFTGDFSVSAKSDEPFSLFGNEVPIVSEYAITPLLPHHGELKAIIDTIPGVRSSVSVVSGVGQLECGGWKGSVVFFGVNAAEYRKAFPELSMLKGNPFGPTESGVILNAAQAEVIKGSIGRDVMIGEPILISVFNDSGFTMRTAPLRGVFSYATRSTASDRVCLVSPDMARSLNGYIIGNEAGSTKGSDAMVAGGSVDDLFSSDSAGVVESSGAVDLAGLERQLGDSSDRKEAIKTTSDAWNFILLKTNSSSARTTLDIRAAIDVRGLDARVLDWRGTAGNQAQAISLLRVVFNVGLVILAIAAIIIIMNSLVISVLERSGEIGTMRAIGASRSYVSWLFLLETMIITLAGAASGLALGGLVVVVASKTGIMISNPLLISLFGGTVLRPAISVGDGLRYLLAAFVAGGLAWIYPVSLILHCQPVEAMSRAHE
jgi:putative ABC transport system permease protein